MKKIKFKQYSHKIAQKKLEKWHLNVMQISKVYSFKTKKEQESQARRFKSSVKASRAKKFYSTGLGRYTLTKQIKKLTIQARSLDSRKQKEQIDKIAKQIFKKEMQILNGKIQTARTKQIKEDLIDAKQDKIDTARNRINAGKKPYFIHNTREENYKKNGTHNESLINYLEKKYPNMLEIMMEGTKDENGKWLVQPLSESEAIDSLIQQALIDGYIEELAQGKGYGYIDESALEVISPV